MGNHIKGESRIQATFLPPMLDDWLTETHPARVIDEFSRYKEFISQNG